MTKLQALHNNAARLILVFSLLASYERCIWEALSVEVIHVHLVVFITKAYNRSSQENMSSMQRRAAGSYVHRHEMLMCEHSFPLFPYDPVVPPSLRSRRRKG